MINRPNIFKLIGGRLFQATDAKYSNQLFDDDKYTQMVLNKIAHSNDLNYNEDGYTLLHLAVQNRELDFVCALLDKGLDINAKTDKGVSPLHLAISLYKKGDDKLITLLLSNGADRNIEFGGMGIKEFATLSGCGEFFME